MGHSFSQSLLDEILGKSDIVSVIGEHVALKRAGKSFKGLCPFHQEKTPSFHVHPEKQVYHCFGCGAGGTLFTFIMAFEKVPFSEAVALAAKRAGVPLAFTPEPQSREREELEAANRFAAELYGETLFSAAGRRGLEYLHQRAIPEEAVRAWLLGFAPRGSIVEARARERGIGKAQLERAGLLASGGNDFFRNRIVLPIRDIRGAIVGFGGRALDDIQAPKYLNTAETPLFSKSRVLFGIDAAKQSIRERGYAIVVEGYFDVLRMHVNGIPNAVAPLGTALTDGHLRLLRRVTGNVLLLFDADDAGLKASQRSIEAAVAAGFGVKVCPLPRGFDPDSFIREYGVAAFRECLAGAQGLVEFCAACAGQVHDVRTPKGKAGIARELARIVSLVPDEIERDEYCKEVSARLDVNRELLERIIRAPEEPAPAARPRTASASPAEDQLMEVLFSNPPLWEKALEMKGTLTPRVEQVLSEAGRLRGDRGEIPAHLLIASLEHCELGPWLTQVALGSRPERPQEQCERIFLDCAGRLRRQALADRVETLRRHLREKKDLGMPYQDELEQMQTLLFEMKKG